MARIVSALILSFTVGLLWSACGSKAACGPSTCDGCCDSTDVCRTGSQAASCGKAGAMCDICASGQTCAAGVCSSGGGGGSGGGSGGGTGSGTAGGAGGGSGGGAAACTGTPPAGCTCTPITCSDQAITGLDLQNSPAPGLITNTADGNGWRPSVDSTAGGYPPSQGYVYAKFTATGLEKVSMADTAAQTSVDWDIAFRRYVIRLNGGDSGPGCSSAAITSSTTTYDNVTAEPAGLTYTVDNFLTDAPTCTMTYDQSGIDTPSTALNITAGTTSYYAYTGCVAMTGRTFIIKTSAGRLVKYTLTGYYRDESAQTSCNTSGTSNMNPGGYLRMRWQFLN